VLSRERFVAALSYVWVLCFIPLLGRKDSRLCQFHARQGLVLFLIEVVGTIVFWIPFFGWLLFVAVIVLAALGFLAALAGQYWELPVIGRYAKQIGL